MHTTLEILRNTSLRFVSAGHQVGEVASNHSIHQGSVKMEEHPAYAHVINQFLTQGFSIETSHSHPALTIKKFNPVVGEPFVERQLLVCPGDEISGFRA